MTAESTLARCCKGQIKKQHSSPQIQRRNCCCLSGVADRTWYPYLRRWCRRNSSPLFLFSCSCRVFYTFLLPSHLHHVWDDLLELNLCHFQSLLCLQTHSTQQSRLHSSMGNVQFLHVPSEAFAVTQCLYPRGSPWGSLPLTDTSRHLHFPLLSLQ